MQICSARSTGGAIGNSTGWRAKPYHVLFNDIDNLSISGDTQWSFPAGKYHIQYGGCGTRCGWLCMMWYDVTNTTYNEDGRSCNNYNNVAGGTGDSQQVCAGFEINITSTTIFELRQYNEQTNGDVYTNFGHTLSNTVVGEVAANGHLIIIRYDDPWGA